MGGRGMANTRFSVCFAVTILLFAMSWALAQSPAGSVQFSLPSGGAASFVTDKGAGPLNIGFARILRADADPFTVTPDGLAIIQFRPNNILISETTVPASPSTRLHDLYIEV